MPSNPLVNSVSEMETILNNIDWDFHPRPLSSLKNQRLFNCRKYHWFPATFIPEIPYTLIELLTNPGAKVCDPFCGIGTSYFQALLLNRLPFGIDICSFSVEFARLLFRLFSPSIDLEKIKNYIEISVLEYRSDVNYTRMIDDIYPAQNLKELSRWYSRVNFNALCFLIILEKKTEDKYANAALKLSISSILCRTSNQDRGWGCIADNVLPKSYQLRHINVISIFLRALTTLLSDLHSIKENTNYEDAYEKTRQIKSIYRSNICEFNELNENSIDFVITSPPYPNMVDYISSQRLSYYYFGYDIEFDKKEEIGARYMRRRKYSLDDYLSQMETANMTITKVIKRGGLLCYIMPSFNTDNENNVKRRMIVQRVISGLERFGLIKEIELKRSIPSLKRSHNKKWATLKNEIIHIFKKL